MTTMDKEDLLSAYNDVRDDNSQTTWAFFNYDGNLIKMKAKGSDFDEFKEQFGDDERGYGYIRLTTGDELSKRAKFVLITWTGNDVSVVKKGRMSTDKVLIKQVIQNFAVEIRADSLQDIDLDKISTEVRKAGGADYGTGTRD